MPLTPLPPANPNPNPPPPPTPPLSHSLVPPTDDAEHLRLLSIFHYVVGALMFLCGSFPLVHVIFGMVMIFAPQSIADAGGPPPKVIGFLMTAAGLIAVFFGWLMAVCTILSGRYISGRRHRTFSIVIACILCTFVPFGTVLGAFTLVVLTRPSVRQIYG